MGIRGRYSKICTYVSVFVQILRSLVACLSSLDRHWMAKSYWCDNVRIRHSRCPICRLSKNVQNDQICVCFSIKSFLFFFPDHRHPTPSSGRLIKYIRKRVLGSAVRMVLILYIRKLSYELIFQYVHLIYLKMIKIISEKIFNPCTVL